MDANCPSSLAILNIIIWQVKSYPMLWNYTPQIFSTTILIVHMLILTVNLVGLTRSLDTLDCTRCNFIFFAEFGNLTGNSRNSKETYFDKNVIQTFIDMPVEGHILGVVWIMLIG